MIPWGRLTSGTMIHKMFPVSDMGLAERATRILAPPLVRTMWGIDRINKNGMHVPPMGPGDGTHDLKCLIMVASTSQVKEAILVAAKLGPEGLTISIDRTVDKPMLSAKIEGNALDLPHVLRMGADVGSGQQ